MTAPQPTHRPTYATAAGQYLAAGWRGILPLPPGQKKPVPDGYTGREGRDPSEDDVATWTAERPDANIALRLPADVIGLDVDAYAGKHGGATLAALERQLGDLPPTWRTTSRDDGVSGIRLYHVPAGLHWPGELPGGHVEVIQRRHRYAVVWPSTHPETGATYRWISPGGMTTLAAPDVDDLEPLPTTWVQAITGGRDAVTPATAGLGRQEVNDWLAQRAPAGVVPGVMGPEPACRAVGEAIANAATALAVGKHDGGSRHEAALTATHRLLHLAADGHTGVGPALELVRAWFAAALQAGHQRDADDGEWARIVIGGVDLAAATPAGRLPERPADPCTDPFAGLIPGGTPTWTATGSLAASWAAASPSPAPPSSTSSTLVAASSPRAESGASWLDVASPVGSAATSTSAAGPTTTPNTAPTSATSTSTTATLAPAPDVATSEQAEHPDPLEQARAQLLAQEVERERARRQARRLLDDQDAEKTWRDPRVILATPGVWTLADELLLPDPEVAYRVDDVFPAGTNVLLTAAFKAGKTTLADHLTACLVDGQPFLGRHTVQPLEAGRRVALWNYEVSREMYRRWLRDVQISPTGAAAIAPLNLRGLSMPLMTPRGQDWAVRWLVEHDVQVWVLDPFARAFSSAGGQQENDNGEVGRLLDTLDVIKDRAGVGELVLPTHTGREAQDVGRERARGATRLDDWCDVRWLLTVGTGGPDGDGDDEGVRYFRATGRDVDQPEVALTYDEATRRLGVDGDGPARTPSGRATGKRKANRLAVEVAVGDCIRQNTGCSYRAILTWVENAGHSKSRGPVDAAIESLQRRGKVRVDGGERAGQGKSHVWLGDFTGLVPTP